MRLMQSRIDELLKGSKWKNRENRKIVGMSVFANTVTVRVWRAKRDVRVYTFRTLRFFGD